jgi:histidinol-phosphate/aromatic aminotransferase/cobyric acid decarboxylase-like protein
LTVVGFPANKLIMGLAVYGKKFDNVANNGTNPNLPGLFVSAPRYIVSGCTNPQNPTGGLIEKDQIDKLVEGLKKFSGYFWF